MEQYKESTISSHSRKLRQPLLLVACLLLVLLPSISPLNAQSPFQLSRRDYIYSGVSLGLAIGGELGQRSIEGLSLASIQQLNAADLNRLDRGTAGTWNTRAKFASDIAALGLIASPGLLFLEQKPRNDFWTIAVMGAEAAMLSYGIVGITKSSTLRPRPFLYSSSGAPLDDMLKPDARFSFLSGHTAFPATALFFGASVYSAYHPGSRWKPLIWTIAATGPALTGYLRIKAGKHFPTDVIAGYLVGAGTGLLLPMLHRRKSSDYPRKLDLGLNATGFQLSYRF